MVSCRPDKNKFSSTPFLQLNGVYVFNNGNGKDSFIEIEMFYRDGDGDIGLSPSDTFAPFNEGGTEFYNLKIWMYEKKNGKWLKPLNPLTIPPDTLNFHERLPVITPSGRSKWIEGNLSVTVPAEPYSLKPDTVFFEIQLTDRSLRKSEVCRSEVLILRHQ